MATKAKHGKRHVHLSEEMGREMVRRYQETDDSVRDIARLYEVNPTTVYNYLKRYGVPLREDRTEVPIEALAPVTVGDPVPYGTAYETVADSTNGAEAIPTVQEAYERSVTLDGWANAVPVAESEGHLWQITYTLCQKETILGVGSIEEAIADVRKRAGQEIDIIKVVRA